MRICKICNIEKEDTEFYKDHPKRRTIECKKCKLETVKANQQDRVKCDICKYYYQRGKYKRHISYNKHKNNEIKFKEMITI